MRGEEKFARRIKENRRVIVPFLAPSNYNRCLSEIYVHVNVQPSNYLPPSTRRNCSLQMERLGRHPRGGRSRVGGDYESNPRNSKKEVVDAFWPTSHILWPCSSGILINVPHAILHILQRGANRETLLNFSS